MDVLALFRKPKKTPKQKLAISLYRDGIALSKITLNKQQQPRLKLCVFEPLPDPSALIKQLEQLTTKYPISDCHCSWVLLPGQYQLVLLDALNVPKNELAEATKWRVKEVLGFPVDEVAVDAFLIPGHGVSKKRQKMYVAIARQRYLQKQIDIFENIGLAPSVIDINELSKLNLVNSFFESNKTLALFSPAQPRSEIQIIYQQNIYLIRNTKLTLPHAGVAEKNIDWQSIQQELLLEIHRSNDYCSSQLNLPPPENLLLTPHFHLYPSIISFLSQQLPHKVTLIDINKLFNVERNEPTISEVQVRCLPTIGGALRLLNQVQEQEHYATS